MTRSAEPLASIKRVVILSGAKDLLFAGTCAPPILSTNSNPQCMSTNSNPQCIGYFEIGSTARLQSILSV
jgi:hypothetical protein